MSTPEHNRQVIAAEVRGAAARAGFNQKELGEALGVSTTAINNKWHGRTSYTVEELIAVAKATDSPIASLLPQTATGSVAA